MAGGQPMNLKLFLFVTWAGVVAAAMPAAAQRPVPPVAPSAASPAIQHRPIKPYRDRNGIAKRTPENSIATQNWSGYAVANFETGLFYSSASATWQVPQVSWGATSGSPSQEWNSIWVGIGGFCEDASCSTVDTNLIQLGTDQAVTQSGAVSNYVWYELYPAGPQIIPDPVNPGDIMTASLECTADCIPNQTQTWQLTMTDQTLGWTWTQTVGFATTLLSAEWIVEAPGVPTLPLSNYSQANFDPVVANGGNPNLSLSTNSIAMSDPYGQTSNPATPDNGDWFGACWGYGSATPCTTAGLTGTPSTAVTAALTASPTSITSGQSSALTWDSTNATSCAGSGFAASGTSGSAIVYPTATKTYSLTCSGPGGSATASATVTVSTSPSPKSCKGHKCK